MPLTCWDPFLLSESFSGDVYDMSLYPHRYIWRHRQEMAGRASLRVGQGRIKFVLVPQQSNGMRKVDHCKRGQLHLFLKAVCVSLSDLPSNPYGLPHTQCGFESFPVHWGYSLYTKPKRK